MFPLITLFVFPACIFLGVFALGYAAGRASRSPRLPSDLNKRGQGR